MKTGDLTLENNDYMSGGLVMCGCHKIGADLVPSLIAAGIKFAHFVCLTPEQGVKYKVSAYVDLRPLAIEHNIPYYIPETYSLTSINDSAFFARNKFDLLIQGGWQRLFPDDVLRTLCVGAVGVHGSADFLPKGRGRSPLNWSIIEGKNRFIAHLFLMRSGVDDGDVFDYSDFDINLYDTIETLYLKLAIVTRTMLMVNIPKLLSGDIAFLPQVGIPSYYNKRCREDGRINWQEMDVTLIASLIRALSKPYPGAIAIIESREIVIWSAQIFDTRITYHGTDYGEVVERFDGCFVVNCCGGLLLVTNYEYV